MKIISILILTIFSFNLHSQELPEFLQDQVDFCNSNISKQQVIQLRTELNALEDYLLDHGLLADKSGKSYRNVYKQIAEQDGLYFDIDTTFELLDTLDMDVYISCFYKVLNDEQFAELDRKHLKATERIQAPYEGNITPSKVAQRIIKNLSNADFDLMYFRVASLSAFYRTATPHIDVPFPSYSNSKNTKIETIAIHLTSESEIHINGEALTLEEAQTTTLNFLATKPHKKGIELVPSRGASYESYLQVTKMFESVYDELSAAYEGLQRHIFINEPN